MTHHPNKLLLVLLPIVLLVGCIATESAHGPFQSNLTEFEARSAARSAAPPEIDGFEIGYLCPDLFEGHIFSCPTVPTVSVAIDRNTNSIGGGLELGCGLNHGGVCVSPAIEYSRGSETYEYYYEEFQPAAKRAGMAAQSGIIDEGLDYSVLQLKVHGRYAFAIGSDSTMSISPIVGPNFYRWKYTDCPFNFACTENLLVLDVGAGFQYKKLGLDVYTGINGPNFSARLKYLFGF